MSGPRYIRASPPTVQVSYAFQRPDFNLHNHLFYKCGRLSSLNAGIHALLSPYFSKPFPESTLLHHCMIAARDFVISAIRISDAAGLYTAPLTPRHFWDRLERKTIEVTIHTCRNERHISRRFRQ